MKRALLLALACSALAASARPAAATRYSREALLARVREAHPAVAAAHKGLVGARTALSVARLGWAPTGDVNVSLTGTPEIRCEGIAPAVTDREYRLDHCITTDYVDWQRPGRGNGLWNALPFHGVLFTASLNIYQTLYSFGRLESQIDSGQAGVGAAEQTLRAAVADALVQALRAYWDLEWARASAETLDEELGKLKAWARTIEEEMDGENLARYSEADLARIKTLIDFTEVQRIDVDRRRVLAETSLRTATADPDADIEDEPLVPVGGVHPLAWYAASARRDRPEVKQLDLSLHAAEADKRARRADMLPELQLATNINYSYASAEDSPRNRFLQRGTALDGQWILQLHVAYDFGPRYAKLQQARAGVHAAEARRDKGLADVDAEVARAFADLDEARQRELHLRRGERVAHGWYAIVDDNLKRGLSMSSDTRELSDAARNYFDFRLRHLAAIHDFNVTLAALERAAGLGAP